MLKLPSWTEPLKAPYCAWRVERRSNKRRMHWYRIICKIKLELAEKGICQQKIDKACRYLSNQEFMRGKISTSAQQTLIFLNEPDIQLVLNFT